ncbi:hypothetical protein [Haloarchaeobius baliensis]|uniref:hypothetical protein n=1 Tax=Haloarchaeobius baliensis TaxID=1670458 RepID=UPI003F8859CA
MGWFADQIVSGVMSLIEVGISQLQDLIESLIGFLIQKIVGVPYPEGSRYMVIGSPEDDLWGPLYSDVYLQYILPLSLGILFIGVAYIGVRSGSVSPYRRKKLLRRAGLVFMGIFVWFPLVSIPLHFVHDIGMTLAPVDEMTSSFGGALKGLTGGVILILIIYFVENVLLIAAALVYALRWLGIIVLTLTMPLLGVCWAFDVWPLSPVSQIAKRAAAVYPGLIVAGLPAAVLFRIGWEMELFSLDAEALTFNVIMAVMLIPGACIASILTVYWSSPMIQRVAQKGANPTARAASTAASNTKQSAKRGVRGAIQVHRDLTRNPNPPTRPANGTGDGDRPDDPSEGVNAVSRPGRTVKQDAETPALPGRTSGDTNTGTNRSSKFDKAAFKRTQRKVMRWTDD